MYVLKLKFAVYHILPSFCYPSFIWQLVLLTDVPMSVDKTLLDDRKKQGEMAKPV
jgi:hypothetical protein